MFYLRDPLWNTIPVDPVARSLIDTPAFQRLRNVRQLGLAYLVYPGATHTRFEHALGAYHLARRALALLDEGGALDDALRAESGIVRAAALLHDIGHYPFSHALEEIGALHHEEVARPLVTGGEIARLLTDAYGARRPGTRHRSHSRRERRRPPGPDIGIAGPRQDRIPAPRRVHVWRRLR